MNEKTALEKGQVVGTACNCTTLASTALTKTLKNRSNTMSVTKTSNKKLLKQLKGLVARINFDLSTDDVERECLRGQAVKLVTENAIDQADIDLIVHELLMVRIVRTLKAAGGKMSPRPLLKKVAQSITGIPFDIDAVCRQSNFGPTDTLELVGGKVVTNQALPEINILFNALKIALGADPRTGITTNPTGVAMQLRKLLAFQFQGCQATPDADACAGCVDDYTGECALCHTGQAIRYLTDAGIPPIARCSKPTEQRLVSLELLEDLLDTDDCKLDRDGHCVVHGWFSDVATCSQLRLANVLLGGVE